MKAILKRECKAYFSSPIGYVCVGVMSLLYGIYFYQVLLSGSTYYISTVYSMMFTWGMMIVPIITMKTLSDDKKNKTDQLLLTSPISLYSLVFGKYLAALSVYALGMAISLIPCVVISFFAPPGWGLIFGNVLGSLLFSSAMIAIGIFLSGLTESQLIAAISTLGVSVLLMLIDQFAYILQNEAVTALVSWISFSSRFTPFTIGVLDIASVVFFLSVTAAFLFLAARKLQSRRWS